MAILAKKESRGRQKIKMAKIKNPNHRQVTFSKRRVGLFKKASELCTLCGVEAFIIVFSPGQKLFSFGYPDVESLTDRFLTRTTSSSQLSRKNPTKPKSVPQNSSICELNSQLTRITDLLEAEKNRGEIFDNMKKSSQWWWEASIDELGLHELELLNASLEDLKNNVATNAMFLEESNSSSIMSSVDNNVVEVSEHLNLKSIEAKIEGFCFPYQQADNSYASLFY